MAKIATASATTTRIAFANTRNGNSEIYVMNADGSNQTRLTSNPAVDATPAISPDGAKVAFASGRTGNGDIYVMNADGSHQTRLTSNPAVDATPAISPDGAKVAFASGRTGNGDIYVMNADPGSNPARLTRPQRGHRMPSLPGLPMASKLAFASGPHG